MNPSHIEVTVHPAGIVVRTEVVSEAGRFTISSDAIRSRGARTREAVVADAIHEADRLAAVLGCEVQDLT